MRLRMVVGGEESQQKFKQLALIPGPIVLVSFHHCAKLPDIDNLKTGEIYFDSQCQRFKLMVTWSHLFGSLVRQNITAIVHCRRKLLTL
jgi:hypothetical protein